MTGPLSAKGKRLKVSFPIHLRSAALAALLLSLCFFPVAGWNVLRPFAAWFVLAPLYIALSSAERPLSWRQAAGTGYAFGLLLHLIGAYWLWDIGPVPYVCVAVIEAAWFALFAVSFALLSRRATRGIAGPLLFAALWVVFEWLRTLGAYAFPWFPLAATQVPDLLSLPICEVTGQWGLSFLVALAGGIVGQIPRSADKRRSLTALGAIVLVLHVIGFLLMRLNEVMTKAARTLQVAVAQGAYSGSYPEESLHIYMDLARDAVREYGKPLDLIVCPESTYWRALLDDPYALSLASDTAKSLQTPLLIGTDDSDREKHDFNAAVLIGKYGEKHGVFHKIKIVPLGEFFPLREIFGPIYVKYPTGSNDLTAGTKPGQMELAGSDEVFPPKSPAYFGTMICYESAFGWRARQEVDNGAEFLTVITNDAWFGESAGPLQHADLACLRAVETRRWVVRAATSGESRIIDPNGRIVRYLLLMQHAITQAPIGLSDRRTFYVRFGDWFVALCGLLIPILVATTWRKAEPPSGSTREQTVSSRGG